MKPYTKLYMDYFGYGIEDFIPCECCGFKAVDIHHIERKGIGGDPQKTKNVIENLMAVCRECHIKYGDKKQHLEYLKKMHEIRLSNYKSLN